MRLIGEKIRREVEQMLLEDLKECTGLDVSGFSINWDEAMCEGRIAYYRGDFVEEASGVIVENNSGERLFEGWTGYIVDAAGNLHAYWTVLRGLSTMESFDFNKFSGNSFGIPDRVLRRLTEEDKYYIARACEGWNSDVHLLPYRLKVIPELIRNSIEEYNKIDITSLQRAEPSVDFVFMKMEMERYMQYSERVLGKIMTHPSEFLTYLHKISPQIRGLKARTDEVSREIQRLYKLIDDFSGLVRHAQVVFLVAEEKGYE